MGVAVCDCQFIYVCVYVRCMSVLVCLCAPSEAGEDRRLSSSRRTHRTCLSLWPAHTHTDTHTNSTPNDVVISGYLLSKWYKAASCQQQCGIPTGCLCLPACVCVCVWPVQAVGFVEQRQWQLLAGRQQNEQAETISVVALFVTCCLPATN